MTIFFGISSASSSISKFRYIVVFGNLDHSSESYSGVTQCDCPVCDLRSRRANSVYEIQMSGDDFTYIMISF